MAVRKQSPRARRKAILVQVDALEREIVALLEKVKFNTKRAEFLYQLFQTQARELAADRQTASDMATVLESRRADLIRQFRRMRA